MHAVTVATENLGYLNALRESCILCNVNLSILGQGTKWKGFVWRYNLIEDKLSHIVKEGGGMDVAIILDGYDTLLCSHASDILEARNLLCTLNRVDPSTTLIVAPEHYSAWCTPMFDNTLHRISKYIFQVQKCAPFVLNAGVVVGNVSTLLVYVQRIKQYSLNMGLLDDQCILNHLYYNNGFCDDNIHIAVDLIGGIAYCHANRTLSSAGFAQFVNHNRHKINHEIDFIFDAQQLTLRRTGGKVGVLHAICNADIDQICLHLGIDALPKNRKPISQPILRRLLIGFKLALLLCMLTLLGIIRLM